MTSLTIVILKMKHSSIECRFNNRKEAIDYLTSSLKEMDIISYEIQTR